MSSYRPPTEDLPTFNSSLFNNTNISSNYLQYPTAQGPETIDTLTTTNFSIQNTKFNLGTGSTSTLANQIAIGASTNTVYVPTPIKSLSLDASGNNLNYLTVRDAGVYLYNFASFGMEIYPIYKSIPDYTNFFNVSSTSGTLPVANGMGGSGGLGQYQSFGANNLDDEYLVHPGYGIIVYTTANYASGILINYENTTNQINWVSAMSGSNNEGQSIKVYYKGVLIT